MNLVEKEVEQCEESIPRVSGGEPTIQKILAYSVKVFPA